VVVNLTVKLDKPDIQLQVNDNEVKSGGEETSTNKETRRGEVIELADDVNMGVNWLVSWFGKCMRKERILGR
jgi:hypothetical protein